MREREGEPTPGWGKGGIIIKLYSWEVHQSAFDEHGFWIEGSVTRSWIGGIWTYLDGTIKASCGFMSLGEGHNY